MKTIWIVDMNSYSRKALALLLKNRIQGVQVQEIDNLQQMEIEMEKAIPDLILMDESIFTQAGKMDYAFENLPGHLVFMSATMKNLAFATSVGADFLYKGTPPERVVERIKNILV